MQLYLVGKFSWSIVLNNKFVQKENNNEYLSLWCLKYGSSWDFEVYIFKIKIVPAGQRQIWDSYT
jgi:hypothetical protein